MFPFLTVSGGGRDVMRPEIVGGESEAVFLPAWQDCEFKELRKLLLLSIPPEILHRACTREKKLG